MTIRKLLKTLGTNAVKLYRNDDDLIVKGDRQALDPLIVGELRRHKNALLKLVSESPDGVYSPAEITPQMLPLVDLQQEQIDGIVELVKGGAGNVQDVYPLTALQEGILFHHLMNEHGDTYLAPLLLSFDTRERLDRFVEALQRVIDRHDILRTGVLSEGLPQPVQVVWRRAVLPVEEVPLEGADRAKQLLERFDSRRYRIDVRQAPLLRAFVAQEESLEGSPGSSPGRWLLLLLSHHLAFDHTTMEIVVEEVQAYLRGEQDRLGAPVAFREFVAQARLGVSAAEHEEFFRGMLGDVEEPTAPFGLLDVRGDGSGTGEARLGVEEGLWNRLREQARLQGVSAASVCHLAWAQVLARLTGQEEVVFGTVLFGRMQGGEGVERALGMFVNTLPIRLSVSGQGVRDSVRQAHERLGRLFRHEHASLALAQRCSGVPASLPLFTTTLNYRHNPVERGSRTLPGLQLLHSQEFTTYPLTLQVDDLGERLRLTVRVRGGIEPQRICEWVHTALAGLVEALERAPQRAIRTIDVLPAAERAQVLQAFNATAMPYPQDRLIHELFEEQVERTPGAMAVICGDAQLTYEQLNRRANQLAHYLIKRGVGADQLVGLCLGPSVELIVGMLGVLKAGGAYVPLEPSQPAERLGSMLEDCAASWVLTSERIEPLLPAGSAQTVVLDRDWDVMEREESDNPACRDQGVGAQHLAYVMYTSGSTGQPKGVMVEHGNLVNYTHQAVQRFDVARGTGSLIGTSLGFDLALTGLYPPLVCGKPVRLCADTQDLQGLSAALLSCRDLAPVKLTPSHLTALLALLPPQQLQGCVRVLVLGGEALTAGSIQQWWQADAGTRIFNHYGPTETTIGCVMNELDRTQSGSIPIGRPIANARIYILDERREPVPIGGVGEIYIGGAGVARGYLNRPELTAERFVKDPFQARKTHGPANAQARMYRSGDLGRWRADGKIEYLGRNDQQVKIRGYRIELGEIEAQLRKHAQVREAVVLAREGAPHAAHGRGREAGPWADGEHAGRAQPDVPGQRRLVAYLTYRGAEAPSIESVREHLKGSLPEQMLPGAYVVLDSLPLTANGKLDRRALPAPAGSGLGEREYEPLQGEIEEALGSIWQEVLQVERVGRQNNFFELGGHSLLAVQVITRIRQVLGRELPVRVLFDAPTVQGLARQLSSALQAEVRPMSRADRTQALPLSWAQQRLWFIDQLEGGGAAYNSTGLLRLRGVLDQEALQQTLDTLLERHEVLRTVFRNVDGQPVQVITETTRFALHVLDLSALEADEREQAVNEQAAQEARAPFDLSTGPVFRGRLLKLGDDEHILLVTMHHIATDGWSAGVLIREVGALYAAYREGQANPLSPLPIQYADYAFWQRQWLQGEVLSTELGHWKQQLSGAPALLELPTDRPRPGVQSYRGASVPIVLDRELSRQIVALARRHDATLFMALYAGFAILLSRLSGQQDIVVGTPVANRQRLEIEGLIGFFVNTLALRIRLEDEWTIAEVLERVKALTLEGYAHQDVPFEHVVEALQPQRTLSHSPVFQAMLAVQKFGYSELKLPGLTLDVRDAPSNTEKFDLTLSFHVQEGEEEIRGNFSYASDLFDRATIERWAGYYQAVLAAMVQDELQPLGAVSLLDELARRQVLEEFNATAVPYPQDQCIQELFEAQVRRTPRADAVACGEERISYEELNARANRLAHYLRERGVGPDTRVGICVERGIGMVVGLLGILKAGGAYVPLDPRYPKQRLAYLLSDSEPVLLLTDAGGREVLEHSASGVGIIDLQADEQLWSRHGSGNLPAESTGLSSSDLAYVIYTSGSTGQPKGVMIEHCNSVNLICWACGAVSNQELERTLFSTSLNFDLAVYECFVPLAAGGCIQVVKDVLDLLHEALPVTLINTVPSGMRALLEGEGIPETTCRINLAGEALSQELVERIFTAAAVESVHNLYGPSETTTYSTWLRMRRGTEFRVNIGRPIANTQIYILDSQGRPVPIGVSGEIYIGGAGVARGYLNRPELTAERFVKDPFQGRKTDGPADPQARMYRTGDLGRWSADGTIEYLGRNDGQVKIRGYRIELEEIEAQLLKCEGVGAVVVLARAPADRPGDKRLVAYYTVKGEEPALERLRGQLESKLPQYMVPSAYVRLESMPLTPNGKLDRRALPAPEGEDFGARGYEAPQGELESTLAQLWQEVLRVERVGRHDNFFELGGHSLLAVTLIERMRRRGVAADVRLLFTATSLAALAEQISRGGARRVTIPPNRIPAECEAISPEMLPLVDLQQLQIDRIVQQVPGGAKNVQDIYPLTPLQEGILFHHRMNEQGDAYLAPLLLSFDTRERLDDFVDALQRVIDRHDILRTAVLWEDLPQPVQAVWRRALLPVAEVPLEGAGRAQQLRERFDPRSYRIDVRRAPLLRAFVAEEELLEGSLESPLESPPGRWLLLLLSHHLVIDHTAMAILVEEVQAYLRGEQDRLSVPVGFREFVAQGRLGVSAAEHEEFFREMLGDIEEPTAPFGLLDVRGDGSGIDEALLEVEEGVSGRLRGQARLLGVSAASLCHLAWAQVLSRLTGQKEVVFGTVLFGRMEGGEGVARAVGMFINMLPIRLSVGEQGVRDSVRQAHEQLGRLLLHEHASLSLAQRCSGVSTSVPLFTTTLNYRYSRSVGTAKRTARASRMLPGIQVLHSQERTNYPLTLAVDDLGEALMLTVQASRGIDPRHICALMHTALAGVVEALERAPQSSICSIEVLPPAEREQVLVQWNRTQREYPKDRLVHELFEEQVQRTPNAVAVVYAGQHMTYGELNRRANRLAHYLLDRGVKPEDQVAICMERSPEMIIGLLGVLKAGAAYVPLDPSYPAERLAYMMEDAAPVILLTQARLISELPMTAVQLIALDAHDLPAGEQAADNPDARALGLTPRNLAYVIYTSGSTGEPKGVMVEHAGLLNYLCWARECYALERGYGAIVSSSLSFDATITSVYTPLLCGVAVTLVPEGQEVEALEALLRQPITWSLVKITPMHLSALGQRLKGTSGPGAVCAFVIGGEALMPSTVALWQSISPTTRLINEYGPTETVVGCTIYEVPFPWSEDRSVPIGRPIANARIYILDERREPVPIGGVGEIYIGGAGVARGYLNRPELTAQRFVKDPFEARKTHGPADAQARMYRSGDLARWRTDGTIEYLGRNDQQVKIRGYRIELGEIEAQLRTHAQVREAVVLAREDVPGQKRLVAYYTVNGEEPAIERLRGQLESKLPQYMVPAAYVRLESMPLTPNGKLDRKALPAPEGEAYGQRGYEAPHGEVESVLAQLWQEVLQVERVGRHDNFFQLGGHSLLAVTLIERMRQQGLAADVGLLFTATSLAALAEQVGRGGPPRVSIPPNRIPAGCEAISPEMLPLVDLQQLQIDRIVQQVSGGARNVQDVYPLAPLQEGILFHHLMNEQGDAYLGPRLLSFETREQLDHFVDALQRVIDRHDILRTAVLWEDLPQPVQVVWRRAVLPVEELPLEGGARAQQLRERFDSRRYRMDVRQAPLLRAFVAQEELLEGLASPPGRWLLLLLSHHLAIDHATMEILVEEVRAHLLGEQDRLSVPVGFREFVAHARLGVGAAEHEEFFRGMLRDIEEPTAPFGLLDVRGDGSEIREARLEVEEGLSRRMREQARSLGVSAASLCHLAWAQVLARLTGQEDVVFGTVLFGRMEGGEGVERALGLLMNTLPIRLSVGGQGVREGVRQAHEQLGRLLFHEHASLALAQRCSGVPASTPLFTTLLNYRHTRAAGTAYEPVRASRTQPRIPVLHSQERTNYPLTLSVDDMGKALILDTQVSGGIDPRRICELMNTALAGLVTALEQAPQCSIRSIEVLPAAEREQLLVEWNRTQREYPQDRCIQELFEAQVQRTPRAIAVVCGEERLTYEELNARANQLAHYLRERGVRPDARVGICVERGIGMMVGLLGTLKAGGAYVPLDPSYPKQRLAYLMSDSEPVLLLTDGSGREVLEQSAGGVGIIDLEADEQLWSRHSSANPVSGAIGLCSSHLAYVIYTSGSTGEPKGVMVEHRGVVNFLTSMQRDFALGASDCLLAVTTISFDIAGLETYLPLAHGARLVLASREAASDAHKLMAMIEEHQVTALQATPATWQLLLEGGWKDQLQMKALCGGESLTKTLSGRLIGRVQELWNLYGPTETTIWSCSCKVPAGPEDGSPVETIGRPIANTQIYILDGYGRPVPIGVSGEIYIGGVGVARGYLNRPQLTAERFVKDPFHARKTHGPADPQARMYRTGDLGRWRADGMIEYLGRNDHQVKLRGYRIELGEIEAQLLGCEGVGEAVVVARAQADGSGDKRLVAYYTVKGEEPTIERMRGRLASRLPQYMVPAAYVRLESMPLTPNGKLDRKALPAPEGEDFGQRGYEAPQGELENTLAQLWQEVLRLERVGRHDNFFELGGHSLLAVTAVSRLRSIGINVRLEQLFKSPTVASLTEYILSAPDGDLSGMSSVVLRDGGQRRPLFLVHEMTGDVFPLLSLAQEIEAGLPIYGLPLVERPIPESVEQLARVHVTAIRKVQPAGPYRLAGHSFGGVLAYEIAAQLIGADETVEFLGLLDSRRPTPTADDVPGKSIEEGELTALRLYVQYWFPEMFELHQQALTTMQSARHMLDYCKESGLLPGALDLVQVGSWARVYGVLRTAWKKYQAMSLSVSTYLFTPDEALDDKGWRAVLGDNLHIEKVTGTHLSMIREPHVRTLGQAMSRALDTEENSKRERGISSYSPVIALQEADSEQVPIFCIPGAGASATSFLPLSAALGTRVPVYGLQPRGLDGTSVPHYTVADAASAYIKAIKAVRSRGCYRLLGHSFGGWIALEAACQLSAANASVDPVVLFDTELPGSGGRPVHHDRVAVLRKLIDVLEQQHSRKLPLTEEDLRRMDPDAQLQALLEHLVRAKIMPPGTRLATIRGLVRVFGTNVNTAYAPASQFGGEIIVVQPADPSSPDADAREGVAGNDGAAGSVAESWRRYASRVRTITVPGNHMTMLQRSNIDSFARDARKFWA